MTLHALHAEATYQSDARASASARSVHISSGVDIDSRIQQAIEKSKLLTRRR